jgi:glycosyltransferase involved in cell wall biosynthesis
MVTFSIVIPTYNRAHLIGRTIDSVIAQTYGHWELLIIDDGSTDDTRNVVAPYTSDKRIKYIFQQNAKESAARNHGMRLAESDFVCLIPTTFFTLIIFKYC